MSLKNVRVGTVALMLTLLLMACSTPELGDVRYIEGQRVCLAMNMVALDMMTLPEGPPPTEEQLEKAERDCAKLGYKWTWVKAEIPKRVEILKPE